MVFFFFNAPTTTELYSYCPPLSLHAALPICRRVGALEASLGQTLFERAPSGFVLTAAGRALVPHAEAMAAAAARIHKADQGGSGLSGQLRVSVSEGFGNSFIAPRLGRLDRKSVV